MIIINTHEAKTKLSQLLAMIEQQKEIIRICRNGKPIADLSPILEIVDPFKQHDKLINVKLLYNPTEHSSNTDYFNGCP